MKQNFTVRQGALDGVEAFLSVAEHRSFRKAAAELGVTPSAMSQAVRALEARLGTALFIRTTRSVGLTEAGERFLSRAKPAFEELVAASEAARDLGLRPTGLLRLAVPRAVVPLILERVMASFHQAYPEIEVEIRSCAPSLSTPNTGAPLHRTTQRPRGNRASSTEQTALDLETARSGSSKAVVKESGDGILSRATISADGFPVDHRLCDMQSSKTLRMIRCPAP